VVVAVVEAAVVFVGVVEVAASFVDSVVRPAGATHLRSQAPIISVEVGNAWQHFEVPSQSPSTRHELEVVIASVALAHLQNSWSQPMPPVGSEVMSAGQVPAFLFSLTPLTHAFAHSPSTFVAQHISP